jgi:DNA invertase Pin-like site-specific DNA recombinase
LNAYDLEWAYQGEVSFVSVTQSFNTTLTLNVLLSFAQFEREVIGERVRDKIAASKRKGIWSAARCLSRTRCLLAGSVRYFVCGTG